MSVKDLINAIASGSAIETEQAFNQVMAEKISTRLDNMRVEVAQTMFKEQVQIDEEEDEDLTLEDFSLEELEEYMMSEDFKQLDEISGKVLGSYVQKARADAKAKYQHQQDVEAHPSVKKHSDKISDYYSRREYTKSGESKYRKQIDKARENKKAAMDKIDPNLHKTGAAGASKRMRGIDKAIDKMRYGKMTNEALTVEEVEEFMQTEAYAQLDELSKGTLARYLAKAGKDSASREAKKNELRKQSDKIWQDTSSLTHHNLPRDVSDNLSVAGHAARKEIDKQVDKHGEKIWKREKGIHTAIKKLSK